MSNDSQLAKRVAKCAGCGTPIAEHGWGIPNRYYTVKERRSVPQVHIKTGRSPWLPKMMKTNRLQPLNRSWPS